MTIHITHGLNEQPEPEFQAGIDAPDLPSMPRFPQTAATTLPAPEVKEGQARGRARRPTEAEILGSALDEMAECIAERVGADLDFEETRAVFRELARLRRAAGEPVWKGEV